MYRDCPFFVPAWLHGAQPSCHTLMHPLLDFVAFNTSYVDQSLNDIDVRFQSGLLFEVKASLLWAGFPGDDIPIIKGSALAALKGEDSEMGRKSIVRLMEAVDNYIITPERALDRPFAMPVEDVYNIQVPISVCVCVCVCVCARARAHPRVHARQADRRRHTHTHTHTERERERERERESA
jgi:hypothetical protein